MSRGDEQMWINATKKLEAEVKKLKAENAMKKIIVKIGDYAIFDVEGLPKGAVLEIHSYDFPDDFETLETDDQGDHYEKVVWREDG